MHCDASSARPVVPYRLYGAEGDRRPRAEPLKKAPPPSKRPAREPTKPKPPPRRKQPK